MPSATTHRNGFGSLGSNVSDCSTALYRTPLNACTSDQLDNARLKDVYRIGVDEVSYRKGHRFLTVVADHDRDGAVIWAGEGKSAATRACQTVCVRA